jgi:hypothetical protein
MDLRTQEARTAHRRLAAPHRRPHARATGELGAQNARERAFEPLDWVLRGAGWLLNGLYRVTARMTGAVELPMTEPLAVARKLMRAGRQEPPPVPKRASRHPRVAAARVHLR